MSAESLHLYAQLHWHDEAYIVGNRAGLEALRDAIARALNEQDGRAQADVFTNDGEGYMAMVACVSDETMGRMRVPYTDEIAASPDGDGPWRLWGEWES